jgi:hypothetical protein
LAQLSTEPAPRDRLIVDDGTFETLEGIESPRGRQATQSSLGSVDSTVAREPW